MFRCYISIALIALLPSIIGAQQNTGGNVSGNTGGNLTGNGMTGNRSGTSTQGSFGNPNTTVLGATVNLGFNQVFGTTPTIANTNADPFAAYRPADTSSTGSSGFGRGTSGSSFSGSGLSGFSNAGSGINNSGFGSTGFGTTGNGSRTQAGVAGVSGNQFGGGQFGGNTLGANRGGATLGGGALGGNLGGNNFNRNVLGGGMGGANFLGNAANFLGGNVSGSQSQQTPGYIVQFNTFPQPAPQAINLAPAPNVEVQTRLQNAPGLVGAEKLQVMTNGNIAVLTGKVNSENAKRLAAAMLLLEPGISQVDNQLEVVSVTPPPPSPPQPNPPKP